MDKQEKNQIKRITILSLIILLLFLATGGGVAFASKGALPGDALYGAKGAVEDVQLALSGDEGDVELLNEFANERVAELQALAEEGRYEDIAAGAQSYQETNAEIGQAMRDLAEKDPEKAKELSADIAADHEDRTATLTGLLDQVPEAAQKGLQTAIEAGSPDHVGCPPDDKGKPESAGGQPENKGGKPEDAGGDSDDNGGKLEDAGGDNENAGQAPENSGKPEDAGGDGEDAGRAPENSGKPEDAGAKPEDAGSEGQKPEC